MPEAENINILVKSLCDLRKSIIKTNPNVDSRILSNAFKMYERSLGEKSVAEIRSNLSHKLVARLEMSVISMVETSGRTLQIFIGSMIAAIVLIGFLCFLMVSNKISWLVRLCISFAVGILLYEVFLVGSKFWNGRKRIK